MIYSYIYSMVIIYDIWYIYHIYCKVSLLLVGESLGLPTPK